MTITNDQQTRSLCYFRSTFHRLRQGTGYPSLTVINNLKTLGLFGNHSRRQGKGQIKTICVITNVKRQKKLTKVKPRKVLEVQRLWYDLPSLFLSNVTSLNKFDELMTTIKTINADVVAITEARQVAPETCHMEQYDLFHRLRSEKREGGLMMFTRGRLNARPLDVDIPEGVKALWVRLTPPSHPRHTASIIYCLVYHPPRAPSHALLIDHIINTCDSPRTRFQSAKFVICGDFNQLDISEIEELNLHQVVYFPTHEQNTLDLIITDLADQYLPPQPAVGRSNHLSVSWVLASARTSPLTHGMA